MHWSAPIHLLIILEHELVLGQVLNLILAQGFAATKIHLINSQDICEH